MKDNRSDNESADSAAELRRRAEEIFREKDSPSPEGLKALSSAEIRQALHELRVHQIELEMQNEELRRAHAELDAARARYFDLYDLAPAGYCTISEQGLILEANLTAATLLGVAQGTLARHPFSRFILPEDQAIYYRHRKQLFDTGAPQAVELRMLKKDGTAFWAHLDAAVAQDNDSAPVCRIVLSDITERKRAEAELLLKTMLLEVQSETSIDGILAVDNEGHAISFNKHFGEMWDIPQAILDAKDDQKMLAYVLKQLKDPAEFSRKVAYLYGHKDEKSRDEIEFADGRYFNRYSAPLISADGKHHGRIWYFRDITERKHKEAYRETGWEVLAILNKPGSLPDSIRRVLAALKTRTGFDAVGIRLQDGDDFPYCAQEGFSNDFLLAENTLVERGADGGVCRDKDGNVSLECTCGLVISGKTDPANTLFTRGGSFWTNDSFPLLDIPSDQDPRRNPRNQCIHQGYASVALVPIRTKDRIVGLIQFNDRRKGRFTRESIESLEEIAAHIGEALMRKRTEESLQNLSARQQSLLTAIPEIIVEVDENKVITWANPAGLEFYGEDVVGKEAAFYFEGEQDTYSHIAPLFGGSEDVIYVESWQRRRDGEKRLLAWWCRVLKDGRGNVIGAISTARDITELKRAAAELRESQEKFRIAQELSPDGFTILRPIRDAHARVVDFTWVYENAAIARLNGTEPAAVVGRRLLEMFPGHRDSQFLKAYQQVAESGEQCIFESSYSGESMSIPTWFRIVVVPMGGDIAILAQDITERKKAEATLVRAKAEADNASRAKSEFLSVMSHELLTPLNPIMGFTELMLDAPNLTDQQKDWMGIVGQRGKDLQELISAVLDFSRIEEQKMVIDRQPLALRAMVQDMVASVKPEAEKKGDRLEWDVAPDVPEECLADGLRLRQIILNLLNNALKFTPSGSITLHVQDGRSARLGRPPEWDEAALLFSIRDTGIGIPEDMQAAIFEVFTQADRKVAVKYGGGGAGLGLTIAQRLVELMGGKIWVESHSTPLGTGFEKQGSTFFFTIIVGVSRAGAGAPDVAQGTKSAGASRSLKVLVAEDDATSRLLAEIIMRQAGHTVRTAEDGRQALACMEAEAFDVVLMDIQMPVMDGIEATQAIREKERRSGRHAVVIALTAYAGAGDRERFIAAGMDGYVSKPITKKSVTDAIAILAAPGKAREPEDNVEPGGTPPKPTGAGEAPPRFSTDAPVVVFDSKALSEKLFGDGALIRKVVNIFMKEAPQRMREMEQAVKKQLGEDAARLAHTVKGSAANVGGNQFRAVAHKFEAACKAENWPEAEALVAQLKKQLKSLELAMHEFLKTL